MSLADDTGAVAVIVAVAMTALLAATALAVDVGSVVSEQAQLQNGADAAALAVAQACASNPTAAACTAPTTTAQSLARANTKSGTATVDSVTFSGTSDTVHVSASVRMSFAAALGIASRTAQAQATASWGSPVTGPAVLPLAFASCSFTAQPVGTAVDLPVHWIGDGGATCRNSQNGMILPGGFGWLNAQNCNLTVTAGQSFAATSNPGNSAPAGCDTVLAQNLNSTVLLPVFDGVTGQGASGTYHIAGWAEFQLLGWWFPNAGSPQNVSGNASLSLKGSNNGLIGRFLGFTTLDKRFTLGPTNPPYASIVALTK